MKSVMQQFNEYRFPRRKQQDQLKRGIKVEMEHKGLNKKITNYEEKNDRMPSNKWVAEKIARTHLKENKNYYKKLSKARL